jgi:hypothetical protein
MISQGFTELFIGIELVTRGRVSTQVHHFGCRLSNGFSIVDVTQTVNKPLPFILESHQSEMFWVRKGAESIPDGGAVAGEPAESTSSPSAFGRAWRDSGSGLAPYRLDGQRLQRSFTRLRQRANMSPDGIGEMRLTACGVNLRSSSLHVPQHPEDLAQPPLIRPAGICSPARIATLLRPSLSWSTEVTAPSTTAAVGIWMILN